MNLKLRANKYVYKNKRHVGYAVIDTEKAQKYPENFVCRLPEAKAMKNPRIPFFRLFRDNSSQVARALLADALKEASDPEIKADIERRLSKFKLTE